MLKVSSEAILPSLRAATTFWRSVKAATKTAAALLSIWLFKLKLGDSWLFWNSFGNIGSPSLSNWYSVSDWKYTGVGGLSYSSFLSYSLSCLISITFEIRGLSKPNISLH